MKNITHIFFDLDHTLWDYDTNARETLTELFEMHELNRYYTTVDSFIKAFHYTNHRLWKRYNKGEIGRDFIRENRFRQLFETRGNISDTLNESLSSYFFTNCPRKTALIDGSLEVLDSLGEKYELGIITNGFEETQNIKLTISGLQHYFKYIITSETAGHRKPSPEIFELAQNMSGATKNSAVMIGDNFNTDIAGAIKAEWNCFWFNPEGNNDYNHEPQIQNLLELLDHF